jgi:hypothetical protein
VQWAAAFVLCMVAGYCCLLDVMPLKSHNALSRKPPKAHVGTLTLIQTTVCAPFILEAMTAIVPHWQQCQLLVCYNNPGFVARTCCATWLKHGLHLDRKFIFQHCCTTCTVAEVMYWCIALLLQQAPRVSASCVNAAAWAAWVTCGTALCHVA